MNKIFDNDFRKSLITSIKLANINEKRAYEIVQGQYKAELRKIVSAKFKEWANCIAKGNEQDIPIEISPAGDGYGCDNRYIYFKNICNLDDIGDVIDVLTYE